MHASCWPLGQTASQVLTGTSLLCAKTGERVRGRRRKGQRVRAAAQQQRLQRLRRAALVPARGCAAAARLRLWLVHE